MKRILVTVLAAAQVLLSPALDSYTILAGVVQVPRVHAPLHSAPGAQAGSGAGRGHSIHHTGADFGTAFSPTLGASIYDIAAPQLVVDRFSFTGQQATPPQLGTSPLSQSAAAVRQAPESAGLLTSAPTHKANVNAIVPTADTRAEAGERTQRTSGNASTPARKLFEGNGGFAALRRRVLDYVRKHWNRPVEDISLKLEKPLLAPPSSLKHQSPMIAVSQEFKANLRKVRSHLELLADPVAAERRFEGIHAVRDDNNEVIPGVLRYGADDHGPSAALLGGIHMNEMAGVWALRRFHERWLQGARPKSGNVFVATGDIERALEFIDLALDSDSISKETWGRFNATDDHFNFNRIPSDILTKGIANDHERRAYQLVKHVINPANGNILDIHNTSIDAPPMVTMFMNKGETPNESVARMNSMGATKGLPIRDFVIWKPGPYNGMESIRSLGDTGSDTLPILIEAGGGSDPKSFKKADVYAQLWLRNVMGMKPDTTAIRHGSIDVVDRANYVETGALYHPAVRPQDYSHLDRTSLEEAKKDTFILIRDRRSLSGITGWSQKAKQSLAKLKPRELSKERLDNFMPIKKDAVIAIGLKTGLEIRAPQDGFILMVGVSPYIRPTFNETFANIGIKLKTPPTTERNNLLFKRYFKDKRIPYFGKEASRLETVLPDPTPSLAKKLIRRIREIKLYAHSYSFNINFYHGDFNVVDLLNFASKNGLQGAHIHVDDILAYGRDPTSWTAIADLAKRFGLEIVLEISATSKNDVDSAIKMAEVMHVTNIRLYPREVGRVSAIIPKIIKDLRYATSHPAALRNNIVFHLEQHEDLNSSELAGIIKSVGSSRLKHLFDFTNMVTAFEHPLESLSRQKQRVEFAHVCDATIERDGDGYSMLGVKTGDGDIPIRRLILDLLMEDGVKVFALEEQAGLFVPPFRHPKQGPDPFIPFRGPSETPTNAAELDSLREAEINNAAAQIATIRRILEEIRMFALDSER